MNDIAMQGAIVEKGQANLLHREKIEALQKAVLELPQAMPELEHFFAHKIYARKGIIKKGTILVGAIKKYSHINIIVYGDSSVFTEDGEARIKGHTVLVSQGGTKRVIYAHEDTLWITIISANETEPEKIEEEVLCKTYDDFLEYCGNQKLIGE